MFSALSSVLASISLILVISPFILSYCNTPSQNQSCNDTSLESIEIKAIQSSSLNPFELLTHLFCGKLALIFFHLGLGVIKDALGGIDGIDIILVFKDHDMIIL